jgi:hypothetical protein
VRLALQREAERLDEGGEQAQHDGDGHGDGRAGGRGAHGCPVESKRAACAEDVEGKRAGAGAEHHETSPFGAPQHARLQRTSLHAPRPRSHRLANRRQRRELASFWSLPSLVFASFTPATACTFAQCRYDPGAGPVAKL